MEIDLENIYPLVFDAAIRFKRRYPGILQEVEDLYQEGIIALLVKLAKYYNGKSSLSTFAFRTCWWCWLRLTYHEVHHCIEVTNDMPENMPSTESLDPVSTTLAGAGPFSRDAQLFLDVVLSLPEGFRQYASRRPQTAVPRLVGEYIDLHEKRRAQALREEDSPYYVPYYKRWGAERIKAVSTEIREKLA